MTIQNLIRFVKVFEREWNKRFQLSNQPKKNLQNNKRSESNQFEEDVTAIQPPQPVLKADEPILNQLEDLALAGDEVAEEQLNQITSNPEALQLLSNLRLPKSSGETGAGTSKTKMP